MVNGYMPGKEETVKMATETAENLAIRAKEE